MSNSSGNGPTDPIGSSVRSGAQVLPAAEAGAVCVDARTGHYYADAGIGRSSANELEAWLRELRTRALEHPVVQGQMSRTGAAHRATCVGGAGSRDFADGRIDAEASIDGVVSMYRSLTGKAASDATTALFAHELRHIEQNSFFSREGLYDKLNLATAQAVHLLREVDGYAVQSVAEAWSARQSGRTATSSGGRAVQERLAADPEAGWRLEAGELPQELLRTAAMDWVKRSGNSLVSAPYLGHYRQTMAAGVNEVVEKFGEVPAQLREDIARQAKASLTLPASGLITPAQAELLRRPDSPLAYLAESETLRAISESPIGRQLRGVIDRARNDLDGALAGTSTSSAGAQTAGRDKSVTLPTP